MPNLHQRDVWGRTKGEIKTSCRKQKAIVRDVGKRCARIMWYGNARAVIVCEPCTTFLLLSEISFCYLFRVFSFCFLACKKCWCQQKMTSWEVMIFFECYFAIVVRGMVRDLILNILDREAESAPTPHH